MKRFHSLLFVMATLALCLLSGCDSDTGMADDADKDKPEHTYTGLKQQKCAVMVWADLRIRAEYGQIQLDLARLIQNQLTEQSVPEADRDDKKKAKPTTEFVDAASVVRFQREHPEVDGAPVVNVAPRLGASRVIYVEIEDFSAQSATSIMILKGNAQATLRVLEVTDHKAKVAFEESGIKGSFPPHAPEGVIPSDKVNARTIYEGTLRDLADRITARFEEKS
ncbi:MAG: hypothetical protein ABSH20_19175 [Tepidisphaeraceae bacterium]|jgi:hypothetical protein